MIGLSGWDELEATLAIEDGQIRLRLFKLLNKIKASLFSSKHPALEKFLGNHRKRLNAEKDILPYLEKQSRNLANSENAAVFDSVTRWLTKQLDVYYQRITQEPEPALVETIPSIGCNCDDCKEILKFMRSSKEEIELGRLKVQCEHLSLQIRLNRVEVEHCSKKKPGHSL